MIKKIDNNKMGRSDLGWLKSLFHFSFADYYNTQNMNFGVLRVINDDLIEAGTGFDTHPHRNMEIISYVVDGHLTHGDSMNNKETINRGHVQYMSAGTGIYHSEHNLGKEQARFLQIWILPDKNGHTPQYGDFRFDWELRKDRWLHIVSSVEGDAPIKIHQDVNFHLLELTRDNAIDFHVGQGRQAYLVQIEGRTIINDVQVDKRDGLEIVEEDIHIVAEEKSHLLVIEMKKSE